MAAERRMHHWADHCQEELLTAMGDVMEDTVNASAGAGPPLSHTMLIMLLLKSFADGTTGRWDWTALSDNLRTRTVERVLAVGERDGIPRSVVTATSSALGVLLAREWAADYVTLATRIVESLAAEATEFRLRVVATFLDRATSPIAPDLLERIASAIIGVAPELAVAENAAGGGGGGGGGPFDSARARAWLRAESAAMAAAELLSAHGDGLPAPSVVPLLNAVCTVSMSESDVAARSGFDAMAAAVEPCYPSLHHVAQSWADSSFSAMANRDPEVAIGAFELWSSLAECELERGGDAPLCRQALTRLPLLLTGAMTRPDEETAEDVLEEDEYDEVWSRCEAAGACLQLVTLGVGRDILPAVVSFVDEAIVDANWRRRDAAATAIGAICGANGPALSASDLAPLLAHAPRLLSFAHDAADEAAPHETQALMDSAMWAVARMLAVEGAEVDLNQVLAVVVAVLPSYRVKMARRAVEVIGMVAEHLARALEGSDGVLPEAASTALAQLPEVMTTAWETLAGSPHTLESCGDLLGEVFASVVSVCMLTDSVEPLRAYLINKLEAGTDKGSVDAEGALRVASALAAPLTSMEDFEPCDLSKIMAAVLPVLAQATRAEDDAAENIFMLVEHCLREGVAGTMGDDELEMLVTTVKQGVTTISGPLLRMVTNCAEALAMADLTPLLLRAGLADDLATQVRSALGRDDLEGATSSIMALSAMCVQAVQLAGHPIEVVGDFAARMALGDVVTALEDSTEVSPFEDVVSSVQNLVLDLQVVESEVLAADARIVQLGRDITALVALGMQYSHLGPTVVRKTAELTSDVLRDGGSLPTAIEAEGVLAWLARLAEQTEVIEELSEDPTFAAVLRDLQEALQRSGTNTA